MKATQVGNSLKSNEQYEPTEVEEKPCCECQKPLKAPWATVDNRENWVCCRTCYELHVYGVTHNAVPPRNYNAG